MAVSSWDFWQRGALEPSIDPIADSEITPQDHDLIVRYALVGIFLILGTASLSISKAVTLPVVAGIIFGLVLGPLADRLTRTGLPQGFAAGLLVAVGVLAIITIIGLFAAPIALWSDSLPGMIAALKSKLAGILDMAKRFDGMAGDLSSPGAPKVSVTGGSPLLGIAVGSTSVAGAALIFTATVFFYLASRRHLKAKMLRLCLGRNARHSAGEFFQQIETRVAAYFGVVTVINLGMGIIAMAVAWAAGLPFPVFWGVAAFVLNYVAFIGPIIMSGLLLGAGLIGSRTIWEAVLPALVYIVVHLIEANAVTPVAVGRRLTLSPFMVFLSFVFWLWLWGPVGAILSTPILLVATIAIDAMASYRKAEIIAHDELVHAVAQSGAVQS